MFQNMGLTHRYLEAFKAADKDKSGTLTRSELKSVLATKGIPISEIDVSSDFHSDILFFLMWLW